MNPPCPSDGRLIAFFMGELAPRPADKLARHIADCRRCSVRLSVLQQVKRDLRPKIEEFANSVPPAAGATPLREAARLKLGAAAPAAASVPGGPRPSRLFGPKFGLRHAAAFLLVAVIAGSAYLALPRLRSSARFRSPALTISLLSPAGSIPAAPRLLRWSPVLNAESYLLEIFDERLNSVHRSSTFLITEYRLPDEVRSHLVRGETYVWSISASDGDGNVVTTGSGWFVIGE
jgi:hypothetical protein